MRVWVVEVGEPLPEIDGSFRDFRCGLLCKALAARGHDVTWWVSTFAHMEKRHRFDGPRTVFIQRRLEARFLDGPGYARNISRQRIRHNRITAREFAREAEARPERPAVILCSLPTPELSAAAVEFGAKTGTPVLIDIQDVWPDQYLTLVRPALRPLLRIALVSEFGRVRRLLGKASGITAISERYLRWALDLARRERRWTDGVFPMGYRGLDPRDPRVAKRRDELVAQYGFKPEELIVTFVGTLGSSYRLDTVIRAARLLAPGAPASIRVVIVGDGERGAELRSRAEGLENVTFAGWFDQVSLTAMLDLSAVGLAPYRHDASMSLPNKPYEYMAAGLPILSSLRGELEALIRTEQIGLQYEAHDVADLVQKLRWLASNPDARRSMGARARALFEQRFSVEVVYPELIGHLEAVAERWPRDGRHATAGDQAAAFPEGGLH
jgi:glycosyltransferase involved in cell wall biosynthesis